MKSSNENTESTSFIFYHGDCIERMKTISAASVSLIVFDPPYATTALKWDKHLNYEAVIAEFERILTPTGTVVAFGSDQFTFHLFNVFVQHGKAIKYRYSAIWMKNRATGFLHATNRPLKVHEDIMVFSKGLMGHAGTGPGKTLKRMTYNPQNLVELAAPIKSRNGKMNGGVTSYKGGADGRYLGKLVGTTASRNADCAYLGREPACAKTAERRRADSHLRGREQEDGSIILWGKPRKQSHTGYTKTIFSYDRESIPDDPHRHPTKKPQALLKELVATFSNPGETVLDPTMGSGTTGAACVELGDRSFIGIERDGEYFAICQTRICQPPPIEASVIDSLAGQSPVDAVEDEVVSKVLARMATATPKNKYPAWKVRQEARRAARKAARRAHPAIAQKSGPEPEPPANVAANDNAAPAAVTLHLGDCLETMKTMASGSVDLIVTSPPYNLGEGNAVHWHEKGAWRKRPALADGYANHNDAMPYADYVAWQKSLLTEMWRLIPDDGAIFYQHKNRVQKGILRTPHDLNPGLPLRQIIIWNRSSGMNFSKSNFTPSHELIFIFAKPNFRLTKYAADMDLWNIRPDRGSDHPAPYPLELARRCIEHTSAKTIFDPFSGSGTTGVAALELGRNYIGCELDPGYLEASRLRLAGVEVSRKAAA